MRTSHQQIPDLRDPLTERLNAVTDAGATRDWAALRHFAESDDPAVATRATSYMEAIGSGGNTHDGWDGFTPAPRNSDASRTGVRTLEFDLYPHPAAAPQRDPAPYNNRLQPGEHNFAALDLTPAVQQRLGGLAAGQLALPEATLTNVTAVLPRISADNTMHIPAIR